MHFVYRQPYYLEVLLKSVLVADNIQVYFNMDVLFNYINLKLCTSESLQN